MLNDSGMRQKISITVAYGDGIGPGIREASLHIVPESGAQFEPETIGIGGKVCLRGNFAGIDEESCCRCENGGQPVTQGRIAALCQKVIAAGFDIVKTATLRTFDGQQGFTLAQGQ